MCSVEERARTERSNDDYIIIADGKPRRQNHVYVSSVLVGKARKDVGSARDEKIRVGSKIKP